MRFLVLGPLEVWRSGRRVNLGGRRQCRLLATLLTAADRSASVSHLIAVLWDEPPPTARTQVQNCVSMLRRSLAGEGSVARIDSTPAGYRLSAPDDAVDLCGFTDLLALGRERTRLGQLDEALHAYRQALGLWRGPALGELAAGRLKPSAVRLDEARGAALEECLELELAGGRGARVTGELYELISEFPFREGLHRLLMLALCDAGRTAEALEVARDARKLFIEELGIEPGAALREAELAILNGGPATAPAVPQIAVAATGPCSLPPKLPDFTGRAAELATIESAIESAVRLGTATIAISGPSGIGKTALAVQAAHALCDRFPGGQHFVDLEAGTEGGIAVEAVRRLAAGRKVLLVLDNATDEAQVRSLLPGDAGSAAIVTSRAPLRGLSATGLRLGPLGEREEIQLLRRIVGPSGVDSESAAELVRMCGRMPLAIRIVGQRLREPGAWGPARAVDALRDERLRLGQLVHGDLSVRGRLLHAYQLLDPDAQQAFHRLGALGLSELPLWLAAAACGRSIEHTRELLRRLVDAQHISVVPHQFPRFRVPDLTRLFAEECALEHVGQAELLETRLRALGGALHLAETAGAWSSPGHHSAISSPARRWIDLGVDLSSDPLGWFDGECETLTSLVIQASRWDCAQHAWGLAAALLPLYRSRGRLKDWRRSHDSALSCCRILGDRLGVAVALYGLGDLNLHVNNTELALVQITEASQIFQQIGHREGHAMCESVMSHLPQSGSHTRAAGYPRQALAVGGRGREE